MKTSKRRFDDYEVYQKLCDHLSIHESRRKAVFGVDDFYIHAKELIGNGRHDKIKKIRNTSMFRRFFINHKSRGEVMTVGKCKIRFNPYWKTFRVSYLDDGYPSGEFATKGDAIEDARRA